MSIYSSKRKSRRASSSQLGHLKLSVFEDSSALLINVYEARGLLRREGAPLDTYVKLYLLPDPQKETKEKTIILKQKDPVFNEKFSFILNGPEDIDRKLLISVWTHYATARNEMIGCMTFKVAELLGPDKGLNGWYQLLDEVKGQETYCQVPLSISRYEGVHGDPGKRSFAMTLVRSEHGYGFSVDGYSPVFIAKVLKGYPAAEAGIKVGDQLLEIEGVDITKASAEFVSNICKKCPQVIHLILQRGHTRYPSQSLRHHKLHLYPQLPLHRRQRPHRSSQQLSSSYGLFPEYHSHNLASRRASTPIEAALTQPDLVCGVEADHMTDNMISRWPSSGLERSREQLYASQGHLRLADSTSQIALHPTLTRHQSHTGHTLTLPHSNTVHNLTQPSNEPHTLTKLHHRSQTLTQTDNIGTLVKTVSSHNKMNGAINLDSAHTSGQERALKTEETVDWESLGVMGQQRQRAMNNLHTTQLTLSEELKMGVETYVHPLRAVLPFDVHQRMFKGLVQLSTVAMVITSQLKTRQLSYSSESAPLGIYIESLADIYSQHLPELLECLGVALDNYGVARQEIATSFAMFEQFSQLVQDSVVKEQKHSIYSFVEAVNEYLPKLSRSMFALVYFTPLAHEDQRHLQNITSELMRLCRDKELVDRWDRQQESMRRLQVCVGFGAKVKQCRVQVPGRLLIQEGELQLIERKKKRKVWLLLLSDILLVTRKQSKIMTVVEDPLSLEHVMVQDFHCTDANEIQISTMYGSWSRLFRASSEAEKDVWMAKIKERASGSLSNRRKQSDKTRSSLQPHIADALRKQSQQLQASAVPKETTTRIEAQQLKRGSSKRRSLFGVGAKRDKFSPERDSKIKRSFRGKLLTPKKLALADVSVEVLEKWKTSFDTMIHNDDGLALFEEFLKSEFSEENIQFWKACQQFKTVPMETLANEAKAIYDEYILQRAPKWVNLDHPTTKEITERLAHPDHSMFLKAQHQIYILMQRDSFKRYVDSKPFQSALKR